MKVHYPLNRTKRSSRLVVLFLIVCTIIMIGMPPFTSISSIVRKAWADSVIATIGVGLNPRAIAFDPANGNLYVANQLDNTVSVISGQTNTVIGNPIPVGTGNGPFEIAFDSFNGDLYVTNSGTNTVSVIDGQTNTVIGNPIPVGQFPSGIAFDSSNGNLYVTNLISLAEPVTGTVSVISGQTNTVVGSPISVGATPFEIAFDPAKQFSR
jgi:YVTN family beta-propeller protein